MFVWSHWILNASMLPTIDGGVLPGMLFRVRRECVLAVFFNFLGAVGFGALIIGGASVIRVTECSTLCSSLASSTLCSAEGAGGMYG
jgi:hypothetical protein